MEKIDRFHWNLARFLFGISSVCSVLGIVFNSIIFLTTIKTKSLRATYNILIAICAIADVFHQYGTLVQLPFLFDHFLLMNSNTCGIILFPAEIGIGVGCTCILCIGLDRMISVIFSTQYRTLDKRYYHAVLGSLIVGYCTFLCGLLIKFYRPQIVFCQIMAPFADEGVIWFNSANCLVNVISVFVYFATWLGLRSHADSKAMRRIIKSLFIIVTVDVTGWVLTPGLLELSQHLDFEPQHQLVWTYFSIIFVNLGISVKLLIYYSTSSEYRSALRSFLFRKIGQSGMSVVDGRTITVV